MLPELALGLVGHVDHGKTTLVQALSGKWTDTHSEELKRGITIRLGYAEFSIYKCTSCGKLIQTKNCKCGGTGQELRAISLVDAPGHESLMATMLCGSAAIDAALLLIAADEPCPQPQTIEHLKVLEIVGIENVIVVQNKIDLVSDARAEENYNEIKSFLADTKYANAPIIPISALHSVNIDVLLEELQKIQKPERALEEDPLMLVIRSFDINKPGTRPDQLQGAVLGGVLKAGCLASGQEIQILPGYEKAEKGAKVWKPISTKITKIMAGAAQIDKAQPGFTFGIMSELEPSIARADRLANSIAGLPGKLPEVLQELSFKPRLLERVVGAKDKLVVEPIKIGEPLLLNILSCATIGIVKGVSKSEVKCALKRPVPATKGWKLTISRAIGQRWRLIGWGEL